MNMHLRQLLSGTLIVSMLCMLIPTTSLAAQTEAPTDLLPSDTEEVNIPEVSEPDEDVLMMPSESPEETDPVSETETTVPEITQNTATPMSGTCGENLTWTLDSEGVLTISGTGAMTNYVPPSGSALPNTPWRQSGVKSIVIEPGVTSIGDYAFSDLTTPYPCLSSLKSVTISDTVTSIGQRAFRGNGILKVIELPDSITFLGSYVFSQCGGLTSITIPSQVKHLNGGTFNECGSLHSISLPEGLLTLGLYEFDYCGIRSITFPASLTELSPVKFGRPRKLTDIQVSDENPAYTSVDGVLYSKDMSTLIYFPDGKVLDTFTVPEGVTTIITEAMNPLTAPNEIVLPDGIKTFEAFAFRDPYIRTFRFLGNPPTKVGPNFPSNIDCYIPFGSKTWTAEAKALFPASTRWHEVSPYTIDPSKDAWSFLNSETYFGKPSEGYEIFQEDYDQLMNAIILPDDRKAMMDNPPSTSGFFKPLHPLGPPATFHIFGTVSGHIKWGGSCAGMSAWTCLTSMDPSELKKLEFNVLSLNNVPFSSRAESLINFYHHQQKLSRHQYEKEKIAAMEVPDQLRLLEKSVQTGKPVNLAYSWGEKMNDANTDLDPKYISAHCVVGYAVESGSWSHTIDGVTDTYDRRIYIYDCSVKESEQESHYLYYDSQYTRWCIPGRKIRRPSGITEINNLHNNGCLTLITTDDTLYAPIKYQGNVTYKRPNTAFAQLRNPATQNAKVTWKDRVFSLMDWSLGRNGVDHIRRFPLENTTADGTISEDALSVTCLPDPEAEYTVATLDNEPVSFSMHRNGLFSTASAEKPGSITFAPDGSLILSMETEGKFFLSLTNNTSPIDYPTLDFSGTGTQASITAAEDGYILSGDNLDNISLTVGDDKTDMELTFSTEEELLFLTKDETGRPAAYVDPDKNGTYDTPLENQIPAIENCTVTLDKTTFTYDGKAKTPAVTVTHLGNTLTEGEAYTVHYENNVKVGTASVIIEGIGDYSGTVTRNFKIVGKSSWLYDDVPETSGWRYDAIKYVTDHGIMNGISGTRNFDPDGMLTREMFAAIIYRVEGSPAASYDGRFPDVKDPNYYVKPIAWASTHGIITGHSNTGLFGVRENITREDLVVIMYRYARTKGYNTGGGISLSKFPDAAETSGYAVEAMKWAVGNGIVNGRSNTGLLDPKGNAARVEAAAIIQRFMTKIR